MKKIMILNGSARTNGKTSALTRAFKEGAEQNGNEVREFFLTKMNIRECTGCDACVLGKVATCAQKDDMESIYEAYEWADVVVFASPLYWWHITGLLKMAVDRLYSTINRLGHDGFCRDSVLLMTANSLDWDQPLAWYSGFINVLKWNNLGIVLGTGKTKEAQLLGTSII